MKIANYTMSVFMMMASFASSGDALARGGFRGGGGARVAASTSFRTSAGVGYSRTVAAGRYHHPATLPAYRAGVAYPGSAIRTTRRVARRTAYRTAAGYSYYYGSPSYSLPVASCYQVLWEGMTAYDCNGMIYVFDNGQYYPIEGA